MAEQIECKSCGAVLAPEDAFCGECGAPRPVPTEAPQPPEGVPQPAAPPPEAVPPVIPRTSGMPQANWRAALITLVVLGTLACLAALIAFALFGSVGGENLTPEENWLISALCCLLPIGGVGALLLAASGIIWYTRLRTP